MSKQSPPTTPDAHPIGHPPTGARHKLDDPRNRKERKERARQSAASEARTSSGRRCAEDQTAILLAEATLAAEIVTAHSERWGTEEVLYHAELAKLAEAETRTWITSTLTSRRQRPERDEQLARLDQAVAVLHQLHSHNIQTTAL